MCRLISFSVAAGIDFVCEGNIGAVSLVGTYPYYRPYSKSAPLSRPIVHVPRTVVLVHCFDCVCISTP